ncbi:MAG: hypothetical protein AB7P02_02205 [Alphaproteobacteria bacterium]
MSGLRDRPVGPRAGYLRGTVAAAALAAAALAVPPAGARAQAPTIANQVRQLSAEVVRLRDQLTGMADELRAYVERAAAAQREAETGLKEALARTDTRGERLETAVGKLEGDLAAALDARLDPLTRRLSELEAELAAVERRNIGATEAAARDAREARDQVAERIRVLDQAEEERAAERSRAAAAAELSLKEALELLAERSRRLAAAESDLAEANRRAAVASADITELRRALETVTARTAALEQDAAERARQQVALTQSLEERVRQANAGLVERAGRLETALAQLSSQQAAAAGDARLERLLAATIHLTAAAQGSRPFPRELAYVKQLGDGVAGLDGAVAELQAHAGRGVPTVADLRMAFRTVGPVVVAHSNGSDEGWIATARRWATDAAAVVGVADPPPLPPARAAVTVADAHLMRGQLAPAVAALGPIDPSGFGPAGAWLVHARARMAVDQASFELVNRVMTLMLTR